MKELHIRCEWLSDHVVEVPDDYEWTGFLDDEWAWQVDSHIANLLNWDLA